MILTDSHIHTDFSTDSNTPLSAQIKAAYQTGLTHICITDHADPGYAGGKFILEPDTYYNEVCHKAAAFQNLLSVHTGIELGLRPDMADEIHQIANRHPWEFIIGSTHVVDGVDPYYPEYWETYSVKEGVRRYYEVTLQNILMYDCFDVYGHIDYIIRYIPQNRQSEYHREDYADLLNEILIQLISRRKGIECNTAGFKYGLGHPNPDEWILSRYHSLGGEILTIGSDGHKPEHIAYDFGKLPNLLLSCGIKYYTFFDKRKEKMLPV